MIITSAMTKAFQEASHDVNPLHLDADYARKTPYGKPVVYGVLGVLAALGQWSKNHPVKIKHIRAVFLKPLYEGLEYEIRWEVQHDRHQIVLARGPVAYTTIHLSIDPLLHEDGDGDTGLAYTFRPEPAHQLLELVGLKNHLANSQLAALLWCSYRVNMVKPGRNALFSELEIHFKSWNNLTGIHVDVESEEFDERFQRVAQAGHGSGISFFKLVAFRRPETVGLDWELVKGLAAEAGDWKGKRVLVTGAMRGFGASLASMFGFAGAKVGLNYRGGIEAAIEFSQALERHGVESELHQADLSDERMVWRMARSIAEKGKLDLLVLNATPPIHSGLLLEQSGEEWMGFLTQSMKMTLNALRALLPLMADNGCIALVSTDFIDFTPAGYSHLLASKIAQESLLETASQEHPSLSFVSYRLPRMRTDQTNLPSQVAEAEQPEDVAQEMVLSLATDRSIPGYQCIHLSLPF